MAITRARTPFKEPMYVGDKMSDIWLRWFRIADQQLGGVFSGTLPTIPLFADDETPAGTINGTDGTDGNAAFTLAHTPNPATSLMLVKTDIGTAVTMIPGTHFNLSGTTITYTSGNIPISGQTHRAWYRY